MIVHFALKKLDYDIIVYTQIVKVLPHHSLIKVALNELLNG